MSAASSPERIATLTMTIASLELYFGTKNLTVWRVQGQRLSTVYGMLDPRGHPQAVTRRLWKRHAAELCAGRTVRTDGGTLVPLLGDELVGFVHMMGESGGVPKNVLPLVRTAFACLAAVLAAPADDASSARDDLSVPAPSTPRAETTLAQVKADEDAAARGVRAAERRKILHMLEETGWNVSETARQLHWSRGKLGQRMELHHIVRSTPAPTDPRRSRPVSAEIPGAAHWDTLLPQS